MAQFVLLASTDSDQLVEFKLSILHESDCVLSKVVTKDPPGWHTADGSPVWRTGLPRAALNSFLLCLTLGVLVVGDGVSVNEMLSILEYQCVTLKDSPRRGPVSPAALLDEKPSEVWHRLAENIASAIIAWPKLRHAMADSVLPALPDLLKYDAGPDRVVLVFASQSASRQALTKSGSFRLLAVEAFARVFLQLFPADTAWTKTNFTTTCAKIDGMGLSYFTNVDDLHGGDDEFVRKIFATLARRGENTDEQLKFANAVIAFSTQQVKRCPDVGRLLMTSQSYPESDHPLRRCVETALETRGVRVVWWGYSKGTETTPPLLCFPPQLAASPGRCAGPSVCLLFDR